MAAVSTTHSVPSQERDAASSTAVALGVVPSTLATLDDHNDNVSDNGEDDDMNDHAGHTIQTTAVKPATRGRPRIRGAGRQANRALRSPVTYAHKLAVIDYYDAHERDINATVREFYAHLPPAAVASRKRQIYKWVKERAAIEAMCFKTATASHSRRRDKGTGTTLGVQGEQELVMWIQALQRAGPDAGVGVVSAQSVRAKALEIATQQGVPAGGFQATWSWQQGFVKRHQDAIQRF